ncbi:MAG: DNA translocase FtsK [Gammaproteobacteria bacterium]|nr:MAG: DNA translocase FtsK [Gammaproteobacteria bacterium]
MIFRRIIIAIKKVNTDNQPVKILSNFLGFGLIGFSIYILISLISYNAADSAYFYQTNDPNVMNLGGPLGAVVSDILLSTIGLGSYLLLLFISLWSLESLAPKIFNLSSPKFLFRIIGGLLSLICFTALCEFYIAGQSFPQGSSGGFIGKFIFSNLVLIFGLIGSLLFLIIFLIPSATLGLNISWPLLFTYAGKLILKISSLARLLLENIFKFLEKLITAIIQGLKTLIENIKDIQKNKQIEPSKTKPLASASKKSPEIKAVPKTQSVINLKNDKPEDKVDLSKSDIDEDKEPVTKMPSTELLDRALDDGESLSKEDLESLSELLEIKLDEFGIEAEVVSVLPGPVVTRFEIQPAPGTKANKITNIAQDIARSLAVSSVRVVEVIEGKSVVGIEIPNTNRKMVRLKEILASSAFEDSKSHLSLALGKDIAGKAVVVNLEKMPHLLVAGTTGSGKSVGINAMLLSLLFKSDPEDVRLILIDPKMLELSVYDGIPHLLTPVITDMSDAANGLRWCVAEMDRRYKLMSAMGVRNLASFNSAIKEASEKGESIQNPLKEDEEDFLEELPSIVVVVDEFADMMMLVGKKVEHLIARIAQKARAAGIHLILATQRPSVDVITGLIKANIPTRISFQVSTKIDSRTVLDQGGAEQLLGYGDMLYLPAGQGVPARVHGAFVGDDEVHRVVDDWKKRGTPDFVDEITSDLQDTGPIPGWSNASGSSGEEDDELYDEAVNFVIESRRASISAVQRKLRIGYNRAARLIESMEAAGLVSEMSSNGSREVLVPKRN